MANKTSFIKLDRNILRWRHYTSANVFQVFVYLLITANYKDRVIDGIEVRRGQCLTTYKEMAAVHKLSLQKIRTVIAKLKETGEIEIKRRSRGQLITLLNYDTYQGYYNFAFFVDMTNNHFPKNQQSFSEKSTITKGAEKQLDTALFSGVCRGESTITFEEINNHFPENQQSRKESKQRKDQMNNYFNNNYKDNNNKSASADYARASAHTHTRAQAAEAVVAAFNMKCCGYARVNSLSKRRRTAIEAMLENYGFDLYTAMLDKAEQSSFLKGKNKRGWKATFDWLIDEDNFSAVLDGNYDNYQTDNGSFDTDEFFEAALKRSYQNIKGDKKDE